MSILTPIIALLSNASVTGSGVLVLYGGTYDFTVGGTFGGATVKLQMLAPDGVTWFDAGSEATLTAAGGCAVEIGTDMTARASVSGGSPSGLYAKLSRVR